METKDIKYPYLPTGRVILWVPENNKYMLDAKEAALKKSTVELHRTGVVIVDKDGSVLVREANQATLKNKFLLKTHKSWCIRKLFKVPSGKKYWLCPGCASHKNHGEYRAAAELLKKFPQKINSGLDLYLWGHWWCCKPCWDKMIEAGIKNVYVVENSDKLFK